MNQIQATLEHIRYQGDEGFLIGSFFNPEKKSFIALGNILNAQLQMDYVLHGEWNKHPKFGKQFKFEQYESVQPQDEDGIYRYLVRTVKWVGPSIAEDLLDNYGDKTLEMLRTDPLAVAKAIKGITLKKAEQIQKDLLEVEETESVLVDLMSILTIPGLRKSLLFDLIDDYGSNAAVKLRENPYILTEYPGTGFLMADRLALHSLDIDPDSVFRARAAIVYVIKEDFSNGNTWVSYNTIKNELNDIGIKEIDDVISELISDKIIAKSDNFILLFTLAHVDENETVIAKGIKYALLQNI